MPREAWTRGVVFRLTGVMLNEIARGILSGPIPEFSIVFLVIQNFDYDAYEPDFVPHDRVYHSPVAVQVEFPQVGHAVFGHVLSGYEPFGDSFSSLSISL